jgi:RAB protein geranylgeranyltransferase component A
MSHDMMLRVDSHNNQPMYESKNTIAKNRDDKIVVYQNSFSKYYLYPVFGSAKVAAHCHRFCVAAP